MITTPARTMTVFAAALLGLASGGAWPAHADPTIDNPDRAAPAHPRDRSAAGTPARAEASSPGPPQDPLLRCDRPCLQAVADSYLKAVVAHDPRLLVLDDRVR